LTGNFGVISYRIKKLPYLKPLQVWQFFIWENAYWIERFPKASPIKGVQKAQGQI